MGLFFKKKESIDANVIYAPISGKIKPITSLKDKTFAEKVMGDGVAIVPTEGKVFSPVDGVINAVLDTHHAYGITSDAGYELLIHVGQDTVNLKGQHFTCKVNDGDKIKKGQLLGTFDPKAIADKGYSLDTPVILIAGGDYSIKEFIKQDGEIVAGEPLIRVGK